MYGPLRVGWVDGAAIATHAFAPHARTRVFVCGIPGVYDHLCVPRDAPLRVGTTLHKLGYTDEMVIKF